MGSFVWREPPVHLSIKEGEVHVWRVPLNVSECHISKLASELTQGELERAVRIHNPEQRKSFVVCRGALRQILASYLDAPPKSLQFDYGPYGKPALARECRNGGLQFNLSHANGMALISVAVNRSIGVDVEVIRTNLDVEVIASRVLSYPEEQALLALPSDSRREAFFRLWTRKEALVKAVGSGFSFPMKRLSVSLASGAFTILEWGEIVGVKPVRWCIRPLEPGRCYVAAVAAEGTEWRLETLQWNGGAAF